jgi:hypothetical protein
MAERKPSKEARIAPEKGVTLPAQENPTLPSPQETRLNTYFFLIQRRRNKRRL